MKSPLSPLVSFLLVALMFPGPSRARNINHQGTEGPREPWEESPGQGKNESHLLHHREKRRLLPRTPPYLEPEPDFKIVNCKKSEGYCQEYCNYMETQVGYCLKKKYACCLHQNVLV
ncbi:sperm-associated antigen 11B isoform X1 [Canis lupus baileyi]|uniref:Sperm associated antigen 11B n=3 Tax=Canis lupus TaxID=9612 RepID=Q30KR3_CANLF|nr:sperm associated antigen 11B precursor [Canis lupus familiaris]XP_025301440.1 sperm-associated antigen 11B isoform X1 [Canis lupus dingo]AAY59747.1 sperm-associated antigen 11 variant C [Canis lupus familiaris]|eukprot:NP_001165015.1 sperm associated antigen 11B precursor [Canis lupus familiaris]